jgi:hypothetical protein
MGGLNMELELTIIFVLDGEETKLTFSSEKGWPEEFIAKKIQEIIKVFAD